MPAKGKTALTDIEKQTIAVLRIQGMSNHAIAAKLKLHHITVSKAYSEFRREASQVIDDIGKDWRETLKTKSIAAINKAYEEGKDVYKGGNLGLGVLRGLGELESEGSVNFAQILSQVPESQRHRYISSESNRNLITSEDENRGIGAIGDGTETKEDSDDAK